MGQERKRINPKAVMAILILLTIGYAVAISIINHNQQKGVPDGQFPFTVVQLLVRILPGVLLLWLVKKSADACGNRMVKLMCYVMMVLLGLWSVGLLLAGALTTDVAFYAHLNVPLLG